MRRVVVVALMALLALLGAWWVGEDPVGAPRAPDADAQADVAAPGIRPVATAVSSAPRVEVRQAAAWWENALAGAADAPLAPTDAEESHVLRGRLTVRQRPWVHPAGVEVRLTRAWLDTVIPTEPGAPERREPTATTDGEGRFAMRFLPGPGELFFLVDQGGAWLDFQKVPKFTPPDTDVGDLYVDDRGGVTGVLVDERGAPVADATVRAVDSPLLDAASGLDELREERTKGIEQFRARGALRDGPLPTWVVRRDAFLPFPTATTDSRGRFVLRDVRPGNHDVVCQAPGYAGCRRDVLVAPQRATDVGTITAAAMRRLTVRFVDEHDAPWVGARVAFLHEELGFGDTATTTSAKGEATVYLEWSGKRDVRFQLPAGGPWTSVAYGDIPARIVVQRPPELRVLVVDTLGNSVAGATVRGYVQAAAFRAVDRALPDSMQPREREPGLHVGTAPANLVIVAAAPGYAPAVTNVRAHERRVTLTMLPLQELVVRTRDVSGQPVADAAVRIQVHDNPAHDFVGSSWAALANDRVLVGRTDAEGLLRVPTWPTWFSLQASHRDFAPSVGPKILSAPGASYEIVLRRRASLQGTLTLEGRTAPAGYRLRAKHKPPPGNVIEESAWLAEHLAVTGADGGFAFRSLCAGVWEVTPELPAVPSPAGARSPVEPFLASTVLLDDGQAMHVVLDGKRNAAARPSLVGNVTRNGIPAAGVLVRLRELPQERQERRPPRRRGAPPPRHAPPEPPVAPDALFVHRLLTEGDGGFSFSGLERGRDYELRVDVACAGRLQFVERRVVRLEPGTEPARANVSLQCGSARILCLEDGRPFGNRMVRLRQTLADGSEGARFELLTEANGECLADDVPAGRWTIEPVHGGSFQPGSFEVCAADVRAATQQLTR